MAQVDFVGGFERLVNLFSKNRTDFLITLVLLVALGAGYAAYENRQFLVQQWQKENHYITPEQFHRLVQIDKQIEQSLRQSLNEMDADRVVLRRFHNGRQDFTGIPFENIADANEVVSDRFVKVAGAGGDLAMASVNGGLLQVWADPRTPTCQLYLPGQGKYDYPDSELRAWAVAANIHWTIVCPVVNLQRYPIGVVAASSTVPAASGQIEAYMRNLAMVSSRISGYLEAKLEVGGEHEQRLTGG